jgi:hypothetical protein
MIEAHDGYNLDEICPTGWSDVAIEETFLQGLAAGWSWQIWTPQNVRIVCAENGNAGPAQAPAGTPQPTAPPPPPAQ